MAGPVVVRARLFPEQPFPLRDLGVFGRRELRDRFGFSALEIAAGLNGELIKGKMVLKRAYPKYIERLFFNLKQEALHE